jgi:hypothetical protein
MVEPAGPPFSPIVRIYPGANPTSGDTWDKGTDVSAYVRYPGDDGGQPITMTDGRGDEASQIDASKMTLTFDNRDGRFSTKNKRGPYYGTLRRGMPITVSQITGQDTFARTVSGGLGTASDGHTWTANVTLSTDGAKALVTNLAANSISSSFMNKSNVWNGDYRVTVGVQAVATGAALRCAFLARGVDSSNCIQFRADFQTDGNVDAVIAKRIAGVTTTLNSTADVAPYSASQMFRIRAQSDAGALRMKIWAPANLAAPDADEPDSWTCTAEDDTQTGTAVGLQAWRVTGNTNAGFPEFYFDSWVAEATEFAGAVVKWPVDWDMSGNNCWAAIEAGGVLRRLQQGTKQLTSPITGQLSAYSPSGYWRLEDGPDALTFGSSVPGQQPAQYSGTTPAADSSLPGATVSATFNDANGRIRGATTLTAAGTGFAALVFVKLSSLPAGTTILNSWSGSGSVAVWQIILETVGTGLRVKAWSESGILLIDQISAVPGSVDLTAWCSFQLESEYAGGTLSWALNFNQVGSPTFWTVNNTLATIAPARVRSFVLGGQELNGASWGHVWIGANTLPYVTTGFLAVASGYDGESVRDRLTRLCFQQGVSIFIEPGETFRMGPQPAGRFIDAIRECEAADYGVLYETGTGLGFRPRLARYGYGIKYILTVADGDLSDPPQGIEDDQRVRNHWTVSRRSGSYAEAIDSAHLAAEGEYEETITINAQTDNDLADHAGMRVLVGTVGAGLRWPNITLDLARNAENMLWHHRCRRWGFRLYIIMDKTQIEGVDPDLIAEGVTDTLWPHGRRVTLNCSEYAPWDIPNLDDAGFFLDMESTVLDEALTLSETLCDIVTPASEPSLRWAENFDIEIGGERMTVTAVSGTGTNQTMTCIRGVGGWTETHEAGELVRLAEPRYLGL